MTELQTAVRNVVDRCLGVQPGEEVLVISDPATVELGQMFVSGARELGGDPVLLILPPNPARGTEPPAPVAAAFSAADVFIAPCLPSLSHTTARKRATEAGIRGATMPGVTADLLSRLMNAEFDAMAKRCHALARLLTESEEAHLTCPRGSDFRVDLRGRRGIADDGDLKARGAFGNLPCGESFIAPAGGEGTVAASSLPGLGIVDEPVRLTVENGNLIGATGRGAEKFLAQLDAFAPLGRHLAEFAIGANERATLTGNILEDEKILGTAHVAFGASAAIGGTVTVPVHLDVVVLDATVTIGSTMVLEKGRYVL